MNLILNSFDFSFAYESYKPTPAVIITSAICSLICIVAMWIIFKKAGKPGCACLIPFYSTWVLYEIICGRGTAMFRLLIPFYNIYWIIKSMICLAHAYGKSTGFGIGLIFLAPIFECILAFGDAQYVGPQQM